MAKIAIIGAGTAGLVSAIRLQHLGYQVEIFEKNDQVGGRMYQLKDQGFSFDIGPTIVMMPELYQEVFTNTGVDDKDYIQMELLDPMNRVFFSDGTSFDISSDLTKLIKQLEAFGEEEALGYMSYLSDVYQRYLIAKKHFLYKSYRKPSEFYNFKTLINVLKLRTLNTAYQSISKFVKDERLRQALSFQTLYIGMSPFNGPSIYTIIPMIELFYGVWYIKGGMYQMAKAMERRFFELGGKIHFNQHVDEIIIKDHKACGLKIKNQHSDFDAVLSNADFPWTMKHLIKDEALKSKYKTKRVERMKYSTSAFILYLGLDKKYQTQVHAIRFAKDFKKNIEDLFNSKIPEDPSFYMYSPSQIDETVAPHGKDILYVLVPVPSLHQNRIEWDEQLKKTYYDKIMQMISNVEGFSDIKEHIEVSHMYTPNDFKEKFNLMYGATFGLRPNALQSLYFRPQATSRKIKNLYFAGSSNHPGAGVPIVMMGAKIAVEEIIKDVNL